MTTKKLLAGVAAAALISTQASGFVVTFGDANGDASTTEIIAPIAVAEEASFAALNSDTGLLELTITTDLGGTFAEDENYIVNVDINGGSFSRNVLGSDLTDGVAMVGGTTIGFDGADRTGEAGETNVEFLTNIAMPGNSIGVELPIRYDDDCNNLTVTVTIEVGTGQSSIPLEQGTFPSVGGPDFVAITCVNAFKALVTSDTDSPYVQSNAAFGNDSFLTSVSDFQDFRPDVTTADSLTDNTLDTETYATLGVASVDFNPTGQSRPILTDLRDFSDALDGSEANTLFVEVTIEDEDGVPFSGSGVSSAVMDSAYEGTGSGSSGGFFGGPDADVTLSGLDASVEDILALLGVTVPGTVDVAASEPEATSVNLSFDSGEGLDAFDTDEMGMKLDDINFEGVRCGEFDWVGSNLNLTRNVWRATGYGDSVTEVTATIRNRTDGGPTQTETLAVTIGAVETIISTADLIAAFGNFTRADVTFNFIGANGALGPMGAPTVAVGTEGPNLSVGGLDCDRLLASPVSAILTPFGNASAPQNSAIEGFVNDGDDNVSVFR